MKTGLRGDIDQGGDTRSHGTSLHRSAAAAASIVVVLAVILALPASVLAISPSWTRQFGSADGDSVWDVAADSGGYTIVGFREGPTIGNADGYIRRYSHTGRLIWKRRVGTSAQDRAYGVASDSTGFTIIGTTDGGFPGYTGEPGDMDIFVRRYDRAGQHLWTRQFGTSAEDEAGGIFADGTTITVVGSMWGGAGGDVTAATGGRDAFVRRYDLAGNLLWKRRFGTPANDTATAVSGDANGITVGGQTDGDLAGHNKGPVSDAFVRRYDLDGNVQWTRQFGQKGDDWVSGIATDATGITVVGPTLATATDEGYFDGFIRRYDFSGTLSWRRIFGVPDVLDVATDVAADRGGLTVTGYTFGSLDGPRKGGLDVFVRRYSRSGTPKWHTQFGTAASEIAMGVAAYGRSFAVVGNTQGSLAAVNKGDTDVFIRRYAR